MYRLFISRIIFVFILAFLSNGCFQPPHNNFENEHRMVKGVLIGTGVGAGVGAAAGAMAGNTALGAAIGGVTGSLWGFYNNTEGAIIADLAREDIQYVAYGDTRVLIVPTDRYFRINSHRIQDVCYRGLNNIARLLKLYPCTPIYVAGFTDEIGLRREKEKLSQARADAIVTFLWANGIRAQRLHAEGYGDQHSIGDNHLIHGSAYNRRIEIEWIRKEVCPQALVETVVESK